MVRDYVRKTDRAAVSSEVKHEPAMRVLSGESLRQVAESSGVPRSTLSDYLQRMEKKILKKNTSACLDQSSKDTPF